MKILALETSAKAVSAAVSENGRILAAGYQDTGLTHSRTLMPIVEHILKNTDLKLSDMDAIAVAVGPGSFTGIRIGVSAAITGAAPLDGARSVQGIKMAVSEINAAGGVLGRPLEIVVEDDANDSATAVNVVNKLVSDQSIVALLGPHRSANAMAVEGIVAQAEIPYLTGASSPSLVE